MPFTIFSHCYLLPCIAPFPPDQCCPNFRIIFKPLSSNFEMGRGVQNKIYMFIFEASPCPSLANSSTKTFFGLSRVNLFVVEICLNTVSLQVVFFSRFLMIWTLHCNLRRLATVSSAFQLLNFHGSVLQIFISCCNNNDIEQMSNHC